jgi:hypothetical protein
MGTPLTMSRRLKQWAKTPLLSAAYYGIKEESPVLETLDVINKILLFVINIVAIATLARWFVAGNRAAANGIQITLKGVQVTVKKE